MIYYAECYSLNSDELLSSKVKLLHSTFFTRYVYHRVQAGMRDPGRPLWAADQRTVIRSINRYQCNCWVQRSTCLISLVTSGP